MRISETKKSKSFGFCLSAWKKNI